MAKLISSYLNNAHMRLTSPTWFSCYNFGHLGSSTCNIDFYVHCISVCQSNKKGYYFGCLRSRPERQLWHNMTTEQSREVLRLVSGRKLRIEQMKQYKGEQLGFDFEEDVEMGEFF